MIETEYIRWLESRPELYLKILRGEWPPNHRPIRTVVVNLKEFLEGDITDMKRWQEKMKVERQK